MNIFVFKGLIQYEIIMVSSNHTFFIIAIAILEFSLLLLVKLSLLILFASFFAWEAKQKRSHEPFYKTHTKIEAKGLRATTFAITKLEEQ